MDAARYVEVKLLPGIVVAPGVMLVEDDDTGQLGLSFVDPTMSVGQLSMLFNTIPPQIPAITESGNTRGYPDSFSSFPEAPGKYTSEVAMLQNVNAIHVSRSKKYPGLDIRLRTRRAEKGLTIAKLAEKTKLNEKTIYNWEHGGDPNTAHLGRVCSHLSADLNWLLYGYEEAHKHGNDGGEDPGGRAAGRQ